MQTNYFKSEPLPARTELKLEWIGSLAHQIGKTENKSLGKSWFWFLREGKSHKRELSQRAEPRNGLLP